MQLTAIDIHTKLAANGAGAVAAASMCGLGSDRRFGNEFALAPRYAR